MSQGIVILVGTWAGYVVSQRWVGAWSKYCIVLSTFKPQVPTYLGTLQRTSRDILANDEHTHGILNYEESVDAIIELWLVLVR